ncbi:ribosomal protein S18-alanine N-acetyltransferase [Salinispirillum sp. LH 10-3-1]|uniref:[Ribosomal protein bS18]-alanine N-acetyltransferase n=1 Tax=Salinispirillum sp. LH 10-3-1 TaxID=2952525 RepID=A0AB38YI21_9GAMM
MNDHVELHFRAMTLVDVPACLALEAAVTSHPWTVESLQRAFKPYHWSCIAEREGRVVGFCVGLLVADEMSILNVAVAADQQRQGIGSQLLHRAFKACEEAGALEVFLEVRQSNESAQALYHKLDFHVVGIRENYYPRMPEGREHALIMARTI